MDFYYIDFEDLKTNEYYERFYAGNLTLPTGKVVCTDPLYRALGFPQSCQVPKGEYAVYLYIGIEDDFEGRVAYAEIVFKDEIPKFWEMSLIDEALLDNDLEKKINSLYPVERGLSCFADEATFVSHEQEIDAFYEKNEEGNYYFDVWEKLFLESEQQPDASRGGDFLDYKPINAQGNMIVFGSGYGDGLYPRYIGLDKDRNVIKFITDFIQIMYEETEEN